MGFWGEYKTWTPSVDQVQLARAITNMDHLQEPPFMDWVHGPLIVYYPM